MIRMKKLLLTISLILALAMTFSPCAFAEKESADNAAAEMDALTASVFETVRENCPIDASFAKHIKCSKASDGTVTMSFDTVYGHFIYKLDATGKKILEKDEPDIEAARAQKGFKEPVGHDELMRLMFEACPIGSGRTEKLKVAMQEDDTYLITFGSVYGDFRYLMDIFTGEILEKEEPDVEAARAQKGFKEPIEAEDALDSVFAVSPLKRGLEQNIKVSRKGSDNWVVSFTSAYGDFRYVVDRYSGKVLEKTEPDMEAAAGKADFQKPVDPDNVTEIVFSQCPISSWQANKIKSKKSKDGNWTVTFGSDFGDFMYVVDGKTGEILEKQEPDVEAIRAAGTVKEKLSPPDAIKIAVEAASVPRKEAQDVNVAFKPDNTYAVTFKTDAGKYMYVLDAYTGEIKDSMTP